MIVDGIEANRKRRVKAGEHDCGRVYSESGCPRCGRSLVLWYSTKHKLFWYCEHGCRWESFEARKP
jgi:hypothetical protein